MNPFTQKTRREREAMTAKIQNETPTWESEKTKIWRGEVPEDNPFTLSHWIVFAPWMHPMWDYHYCYLIHLRDDPEKLKPAKKHFPEATHEFGVLALDPDHEPRFVDARYLTPVSIAQQFTSSNDIEALEFIELILETQVIPGRLSVDSDYRRMWKHVLTKHTIEEAREFKQ